MNFFRTLRMRFAMWISILMLVVSVVFGLFVYKTVSRGLYNDVDDVLRLSASQVVANVDFTSKQPVFSEIFLESPANSELKKLGLAVHLLDSKGDLLEEIGPDFNIPVSKKTLNEAWRGKATYETLVEPSMSYPIRIYNLPLEKGEKHIGVLQVAQALTIIQATLKRLRIALVVSTPLLVVLSGVSGYFLSRHALATIDKISNTARFISDKDLSSRINLPASNDEVGRLAFIFDEMLERLERSFQRERQFTADASHELRTPLAIMQAILSTTSEKRRTPEEYEQALVDLTEETNRLQHLAESLLYLARFDSHQASLTELIDLSTLLHDISDSLTPLAEAKGLTLACSVPEELAVRGDRDALIRLFANVIGNSIKYTRQGGITISTKKEPAEGILSVVISDTGIGIAPEQLGHIFDRFYRVERSRTTDGSGLGLAIALEIARNHGGDIKVSSQPGQGSVFTVELAYSDA